jgi:prepilin-type N-terminal cleavage/methylation domain-containing protein
MNNRKDEGFTLIELLIVIVILGILATIVVFAVRGVTEDSQANACKATQKTYQTAIEAWYAGGNATTANPAPSGSDLETAGLIRDYDDSSVQVNDGTGTSSAAVSTVGPTSGGDCVDHISTS